MLVELIAGGLQFTHSLVRKARQVFFAHEENWGNKDSEFN